MKHSSCAALALLALLSACYVDPDQRCGDHQEYDGMRCICADGYGLVGTECLKCGKHEEGSLSGCACSEGYLRLTAEGPCEEAGGLGTECAKDADCLDARYPHCRAADDGGYCTKLDCETSDDCDTSVDYACNTREDPSFCERPPAGLGTMCTDTADCDGFAADFCESIVSKVCLPGGCKENAEQCHGDWVCCDITVLGNSICIPPAELESGACPAGGTLIERAK
jgi:hypothetical protein